MPDVLAASWPRDISRLYDWCQVDGTCGQDDAISVLEWIDTGRCVRQSPKANI